MPCWPRGLPLRVVLSENNTGDADHYQSYQEDLYSSTISTNFAVLQSLADLEPDVDAIYRLIRGTPFSFIRPEPMSAPIVQSCK